MIKSNSIVAEPQKDAEVSGEFGGVNDEEAERTSSMMKNASVSINPMKINEPSAEDQSVD